MTSIAQATDTQRAAADAEYEFHLMLVRLLQNAAADPLYRAALIDIYVEEGRADMIPRIDAAIAEILENAALNDDEAEFEGSAAR